MKLLNKIKTFCSFVFLLLISFSSFFSFPRSAPRFSFLFLSVIAFSLTKKNSAGRERGGIFFFLLFPVYFSILYSSFLSYPKLIKSKQKIEDIEEEENEGT